MTSKIQQARAIAIDNGGVCLSQEYFDSTTQLRWKCDNDHHWSAPFNRVRRGAWCDKCESDKRRNTIEDCHQLALQKGGVFLSPTYTVSYDKYLWECDKGHRWKAVYKAIKQGRWCPKCIRGGIKEDKVREIIERLTGWDFPTVRPSFLKGRSSRPMELDGYNEGHKIAFEYQGEQHYRTIWKTRETLESRKCNDRRKKALCRYHGVALICVPYFKRDVESFLKLKLKSLGVLDE